MNTYKSVYKSASLDKLKSTVTRHANLRDKKSGRPTGRGFWGRPGPQWGSGATPRWGPRGGEAPGSSWVYENFKVKNEVIEYTIYQLFTK